MSEMSIALQAHLKKNGVRIIRKNKHPERDEQIKFIHWLRSNHPNILTLSSPIVKYGGSDAQRLRQGMIQKRMGYCKGQLDLFMCVAHAGYHGLAIEFKAKGGSLSADQKETIVNLKMNGYLTAVCYSADEAIRVTTGYFKLPTV